MLFSFSRYLIFCLDFLVILKNGSIRKIMLISNFFTSQPVKQTSAVHILLNTSGSKRIGIMKFGHLIEYNMSDIFLEKSCTKSGEEIISGPFSKKSKLRISLDQ